MIEALIKTEADTTIKSKDAKHSFQTINDFPKDKHTCDLFFPTTKTKQHRGPSKAVVELHLRSAQNLASLKKPSTVFYEHLREEGIWLCQHIFSTLNL
jgi:hypothetical protein